MVNGGKAFLGAGNVCIRHDEEQSVSFDTLDGRCGGVLCSEVMSVKRSALNEKE
jgi:hypothetical protein